MEAIEDYYMSVAPEFASILTDEILSKTERLSRSPRSGRMVPEINDPAFCISKLCETQRIPQRTSVRKKIRFVVLAEFRR